MRFDIHFRNMERVDSLENLATEKIMGALSGYLERHDSTIQVWLISERNRNNRGTGSFRCEIEIRAPQRKHYFIQKRHQDMHVAIQQAADTLKNLMVSENKREIDSRISATESLI